MYDLYLSKPDEDSGEEATSAVNELGDQEEDTMMYQLGNFFDNPSGPGDSYADVFSSVARGELAVDLPNAITHFDTQYYLPTENRAKAKALVAKVIEDLKKYLNSNYQNSPRGKGPLSSFRGHVVLNDV